MTPEQLLKTLEASGMDVLNPMSFGTCADGVFDRTVHLSHGCVDMRITWYPNLMTLHVPTGLDVMFTRVEHSGTWPNRSRRNLQFRYGDDCVAVLPLD